MSTGSSRREPTDRDPVLTTRGRFSERCRLIGVGYRDPSVVDRHTTMSESALELRTDRDTPTSNTHPELPDRETEAVDPDEVLSLLSDDHARAILDAVAEQGRPARTIAERLGLSRATVYRRLNRLEAADLVDTTMAYHSEGHHRKHYRARLEELRLSFDGGEVAVTVTVN